MAFRMIYKIAHPQHSKMSLITNQDHLAALKYYFTGFNTSELKSVKRTTSCLYCRNRTSASKTKLLG